MLEDLQELALSCGFECAGIADAAKLEICADARGKCTDKTCKDFDHNWSCPSACPDLDGFAALIASHKECLVFQSIGKMEDDFDIDCIVDTAEEHRDRMAQFAPKVLELHPGALVLAEDACKACDECTYPKAPCVHPDMCFSPVEAAGLIAADVCTAAGIPYYHGQDTVTYIGCVLV